MRAERLRISQAIAPSAMGVFSSFMHVEMYSFVIKRCKHARAPHEAWIAADPCHGGFRVLLTGPHGFEQTFPARYAAVNLAAHRTALDSDVCHPPAPFLPLLGTDPRRVWFAYRIQSETFMPHRAKTFQDRLQPVLGRVVKPLWRKPWQYIP